MTPDRLSITVQTKINSPLEKVWLFWTSPDHIVNWNNASDDWHTPRAENDLQPGGKFNIRMEARDGSYGFDFYGVYDRVENGELIEYTMGDERKVSISFHKDGDTTTVTETFQAELENSLEMQKSGWQAILTNFKKYVESRD